MRVSIHVSPQLQALRQRLTELPTEVRKQIRVQSKAEALPIWRESVSARVQTAQDARVLGATARVAVTDRNINLQAARVGKRLSGGLDIKTQWYAIEFGGDRDALGLVRRNIHGREVEFKRHTQRQLPRRVSAGRVAYPALTEAIPRILSLWVQTVARAGADAHRGL